MPKSNADDPAQLNLFTAEEPAPEPVARRSDVLVGTCSWSDPSLIRSKRFYPRGYGSAEKRLSSFFAMPQASNSVLWAERTPADFVFNVKTFRLLMAMTHRCRCRRALRACL